MRKRHLSRRLVGLLAAYLVALQALILPMSMPALAAPFGDLCLSAQHGSTSGQPPAGQDQNCPCCAGCGMQCHVPALAAGATAALAEPQRRLVAELSPAFLPAVQGRVVYGLWMPRGPPAA